MNEKELDICFSLRRLTESGQIYIVRVTKRRSATWQYRFLHDYDFVMEMNEIKPEKMKLTNLKVVSYSVIKNRFGPTLNNISHQLAAMIVQRKDELLYAERSSKSAYQGMFSTSWSKT